MSYLLSQLLKQSSRINPTQIAVIDGKRQLSYQALDELSNRYANYLQQLGVYSGDRVGIYLKKSFEAVAAIFGILKTGAAYVPLDATSPLQRVAYIVKDCQMKAIITTEQRMDALKKVASKNSPSPLLIDDQQTLATLSADPLPCPPLIENDLAYILYTSGSTGTPKGVMISHRASLTFINWAYDTFAVQATDRVSSHAPFHFDLSIFDIFVTIKAGAILVLVPPSLSVFPRSLASFIANEKISIWYSVPSVLIQLSLHGRLEQHNLSALRSILFAGEVFPVKYLRQLMKQIHHANYYNLYGPTETNVCTYYPVPSLDPERIEPIPIGKACANTDILIVDQQGNIVKKGEVGELCVRGPSLMMGYWNLVERTKKALILHDKGKIYHTGDLVRETDDGNYIYLGRRDNQIKSRGYRIELDEIEAVIYSHPDVEEVAVIPIADEEIGNRILAIVVTGHHTELSDQTLNHFCSTRLPKYMLPHKIEFRAYLPKTSTGKIDKAQLRQEQQHPSSYK